MARHCPVPSAEFRELAQAEKGGEERQVNHSTVFAEPFNSRLFRDMGVI